MHQKKNLNSNPINILLFGTSNFAVPIFENIFNDKRFNILAVITQPSKPQGRKKELSASPVKTWADSHNIVSFQPLTLRNDEVYDHLKQLQPDVSLVIAYGKMIPHNIIQIPVHKTTNVHPSLLPEYRGPSPLQYAILKGNTKTGVSIMLIDEEMDHGPILYQFPYKLNGTETYQELSDTLSQLSSNIVPDVLYEYCSGKITPQPQKHEEASICKLIATSDGELFWTNSAQNIEQRVRALNPEPGTYTFINNKRVKIKKVHRINESGKPGTYFERDNNLAVYCGEDALLIESIQPEGKQWMTGVDYLRGYGIRP